MPRVTMATVAAATGVSKNTVSLALRHDPQIPASTRERIERAAANLGYRLNPVVAELMTELRKTHPAGPRRTLALLNAHTDARAFSTHPTVPAYVAGCRRGAARHGYALDEFWLHDPALTAPRLERILRARGIRGALVVGLMNENRLPARFAPLWQNRPAVVTGVRTREPTLPFACVDHHALVREAMERAHHLGYRRPALVVEGAIDRLVDDRFSAGFWAAARSLGLPGEPAIFHQVEAARREPARFLAWREQTRPDVVLTLHTVVREWLAAASLLAPRDLGLVQLELRRGCADWSGMDQHNDLAGEAASDLLVTLLHTRQTGGGDDPRAALISGAWRDGATTRPQPTPPKRKTPAAPSGANR